MRDDEQWVGELAARSRALVPDVAVDVPAALRGGRRRRAQRRAFGGAGVVVLAAGVGLGVPALPQPTTADGAVESATVAPVPTGEALVYAEIVDVDRLPGCANLAPVESSERPEWQRRLDWMSTGDLRAVVPVDSPSPGAVPPGFEPVTVLTCRNLPQPGGVLVPTIVELSGDLGPFLDFLAQREPVGTEPWECLVDFGRLAPRVYLADAAGRAIAPHWPEDVCGRPAADGIGLLEELTVVRAGPDAGAPPTG